MQKNTTIIVATIVLLAAGTYQVLVAKNGSTITRVAVGAYILAVISSVVTLIFPPSIRVINGILMVAVLAVVLSIVPDISKRLTGKGFSSQ